MTILNAQARTCKTSAPGAARSVADGALGNTGFSHPVSSGRAIRHQLRDDLRLITTLKNVRKCGAVRVNSASVTLRCGHDGSRAGFGGLATCGSPWSCPVCSAKIASHRKIEVSQVLEKALDQGLYVSMLTLTQRHNSGQQLGDLWDALAYAWGGVSSGRRWVGDGEDAGDYRAGFVGDLGLVGYIKATEVTHGQHGWHAHLHIILITKHDPATTALLWQPKQGRRRTPHPLEVTMPRDFVADRWGDRLAKRGVDFISDRGGLHWETAQDAQAVGRYVAKMQTGGDALAKEATLGALKKARGANRTPFQILADIMESGELDSGNPDVRLWRTWEKASFGRRALVWSRGLRDWAGVGAELTDEEIAEQEEGDRVVAIIPVYSWDQIRALGSWKLLDACESGGISAAYKWLEQYGIRFYLPDDADHPPD